MKNSTKPHWFTKAHFKKWLEANPNRRLVCGDENRCALAQFVADETGTVASVSGNTVQMFTNAKLSKKKGFYGTLYTHVVGKGKFRGFSEEDLIEAGQVTTFRAPEWAKKFISRFDGLSSTAVTGKRARGLL